MGRAIVASSASSASPVRASPSQWKTESALVDRAQRLAERLGEVAADGHGLADGLHGGGERGVGGRELLEREPRDLDDDVVERGLERRRAWSPVMSLGISSSV